MAAWSSWASPSRRPTTTTGMPTTRPGATIMPMPAEVSNPQLSWNLARDAGELLEYHFMVNALLAGSVVAVMAGAGGGFMGLRREGFAGHTLSMMAVPR